MGKRVYCAKCIHNGKIDSYKCYHKSNKFEIDCFDHVIKRFRVSADILNKDNACANYFSALGGQLAVFGSFLFFILLIIYFVH